MKLPEKTYDWNAVARPNQRPPLGADWHTWLILAGRGFGKTRTGAETIREWVKKGYCHRIALVANTIADARDVMIQGPSGFLNIYPPDEIPLYESSKRRLTWPNGTTAIAYSADRYEQLRGPQFDAAWIDELAKFRYAQETWDQLMMGLRLGDSPRVIVTTTPKPIALIKELMTMEGTVVTKGSTFDNADNLAPGFLKKMKQKYEGTRLGAQELYAHILDAQEGALWRWDLIHYKQRPDVLTRIVVALDPAVTFHEESDETGIIVAGMDAQENGYVIEDLSGRFPPAEWARRAIAAYHQHKADRMIAEVNNGGDLVEKLIRTLDPYISYKAVRASRGKVTRAEPIAALYEQGRIFHDHRFQVLEDQLVNFIPGSSKSPDRLDALVWAFTEMFIESRRILPRVWNL